MALSSSDIKMICPDCLGSPMDCPTCDGAGLIVIVEASSFFIEAEPARFNVVAWNTEKIL